MVCGDGPQELGSDEASIESSKDAQQPMVERVCVKPLVVVLKRLPKKRADFGGIHQLGFRGKRGRAALGLSKRGKKRVWIVGQSAQLSTTKRQGSDCAL